MIPGRLKNIKRNVEPWLRGTTFNCLFQPPREAFLDLGHNLSWQCHNNALPAHWVVLLMVFIVDTVNFVINIKIKNKEVPYISYI